MQGLAQGGVPCQLQQQRTHHVTPPPPRAWVHSPHISSRRAARGRAQASSSNGSASSSEMAVLARGVQLSFNQDSSPVLRGVDLDVKRGSLHMLLGPNGCGKSTLLRLLGGLVAPDGGSVTTDAPTGFVFQNPDHQVVMPTVAADVAFGLGRYDLPEEEVRQAVASALELVNMGDAMSRATHTLSGGQRQRVAIAGALAENPRLLLLDELTTFLDVEDQFGVLEAVRAVTRRGSVTSAAADVAPGADGAAGAAAAAQGGADGAPAGHAPPQQRVTAIWVTHRFEELQYADAASYMAEGRVVFTGSGQEMLDYLTRLGAPV